MILFHVCLIIAAIVLIAALRYQSNKTKVMWKDLRSQVQREQSAYHAACAEWDEMMRKGK